MDHAGALSALSLPPVLRGVDTARPVKEAGQGSLSASYSGVVLRSSRGGPAIVQSVAYPSGQAGTTMEYEPASQGWT
jgi:hypothetical protein